MPDIGTMITNSITKAIICSDTKKQYAKVMKDFRQQGGARGDVVQVPAGGTWGSDIMNARGRALRDCLQQWADAMENFNFDDDNGDTHYMRLPAGDKNLLASLKQMYP